MKIPMLLLLCPAALSAQAPEAGVAIAYDQVPINTGQELLDWCRSESEARFVGEGKTAYNWTGRHVERGNTLVVEGSWRVDGADHLVECRIARGARRGLASLSMRPR